MIGSPFALFRVSISKIYLAVAISSSKFPFGNFFEKFLLPNKDAVNTFKFQNKVDFFSFNDH